MKLISKMDLSLVNYVSWFEFKMLRVKRKGGAILVVRGNGG
jgi:hypothetical protein